MGTLLRLVVSPNQTLSNHRPLSSTHLAYVSLIVTLIIVHCWNLYFILLLNLTRVPPRISFGDMERFCCFIDKLESVFIKTTVRVSSSFCSKEKDSLSIFPLSLFLWSPSLSLCPYCYLWSRQKLDTSQLAVKLLQNEHHSFGRNLQM